MGELSKKLIEILPSIANIDKSIEEYEGMIKEYESPFTGIFQRLNLIGKDYVADKIANFEEHRRKALAAKFIVEKEGVYAYIEYDKSKEDPNNSLIYKTFSTE